MPEQDVKINILCENYDALPDEGKTELLAIGEKYLNELDAPLEKKAAGQNECGKTVKGGANNG